MKLSDIHKVYLLGIGGIGMSALARYFKANGAEVSGYDRNQTELTSAVVMEGIRVHFNDEISKEDLASDLFIYTPAIQKAHPIYSAVQSDDKVWYKRSEILQKITELTSTIAISGTHGKTTTSAMVTHLLHQTLGNISGFVGGVMTNYQSNLVAAPDSKYVVVEADEYDRSFLRLKPELAVITSLDADHLDIYGTFESLRNDFQKFADSSEKLILNERLQDQISHNRKLIYGFEQGCDIQAVNVKVVDGRFEFDIVFEGNAVGNFVSTLAGRHNVENALAAVAVCFAKNCSVDEVRRALTTFQGVKRRFERIMSNEDVCLIDDYAHHPVEIESTIGAARELFPNRKITVIFQPHLFSRTRDLEDGFVSALGLADEVILLPIYPAREAPIAGVTSSNLLNRVKLKTKMLVQRSDLLNAVLSLTPETVLTLGAGDIDQLVKPLAIALNKNKNVE
jgi:UDP-N-acetylmuramate--alanine ligase